MRSASQLRVVKQKNMVMCPAEPGTNNDCADEDQQQITRPDHIVHDMEWVQSPPTQKLDIESYLNPLYTLTAYFSNMIILTLPFTICNL
jgi:hypothetical protein